MWVAHFHGSHSLFLKLQRSIYSFPCKCKQLGSSSFMVPMASSLKGKHRGGAFFGVATKAWPALIISSLHYHSEFLLLSAITSADLGVFPGGMTQLSFLRCLLSLGLLHVSIHSYKEPGSTKRLQVDCLVPRVFFLPFCVTAALPPAKIWYLCFPTWL